MLSNTAIGLAVTLVGLIAPSQAVDRKTLASYRLTPAVLETFQQASRQIVSVITRDASFRSAPLFSRDIVQAGDLIEAAIQLETRINEHAGLAAALRSTKMTPHDYTTFALSMMGARLAFGFVESGVLKSVPAGVAADNVAFVRAHRAAVDHLLTTLGVEIESR